MANENRNSFKEIKGLNDIDNISSQFNELIQKLDRDEKIFHLNKDFPVEYINELGVLHYLEIKQKTKEELEELIWKCDYVTKRIVIQTNRVNRILYWINNKLEKAVSLIDPVLLSPYFGNRLKHELLAKHYPVVKILLEEKDEYENQKMNFNNLEEMFKKQSKNIEYYLYHGTQKSIS